MKSSIPFLFLVFSAVCNAQLINVHTYPVLSDGGGGIPTASETMGGVSIAFQDYLHDALVNPAAIPFAETGMLITGPRYSTWTATQHSTSTRTLVNGEGVPIESTNSSYDRNSSKNYTVPIGLLQKYGTTGFTISGTYQRYHSKISDHSVTTNSVGTFGSYDESYHGDYNASASAGFGMVIPGTNVAVGIGGGYSDIHATDGLLFLYSNSTGVSLSGKGWDAHLGAAAELADIGELQIVGGYSSYKSTHEAEQRFGLERVENKDEVNAWYLQTGLRKTINERLTVGVRLTGNLKDHPKIPEYSVAGIPRDPGTTYAMNAGLGFSWKTSSDAVFAFEYAIEPVSSETWVEAEVERDVNGGRTILPGEKEQQNDYTFLNHVIRAGAQVPLDTWLTFRFGAAMKAYNFDYHHENFITNLTRDVESQNSWTEVTLTSGLFATIGGMTFAYQAEMLNGLGILEQSGSFFRAPAFDAPEGNAVRSSAVADYLIPPNGNVQVRPIPVIAQRLSFTMPLDLFNSASSDNVMAE